MTYPISESIYVSDDPEWAVAAILGERVVALLYLADIAPEVAAHMNDASAELSIRRWGRKATSDLRQLRALGDVSAGIASTEGFDARWPLASWQPNDQFPEAEIF